MFYVYILVSEKDQKKYIGSTNNLECRLSEHNNGKVISTKYRRPLKLIYTEQYKDEKDARRREHLLKTHKGYNILKKILRDIG